MKSLLTQRLFITNHALSDRQNLVTSTHSRAVPQQIGGGTAATGASASGFLVIGKRTFQNMVAGDGSRFARIIDASARFGLQTNGCKAGTQTDQPAATPGRSVVVARGQYHF